MVFEDILHGIESNSLEYKLKINEALFKTLSAFSNTQGGVVLVGISDAQELVGVELSNRDIEDFTNKIVNKLGVHPIIEILEAEGKKVLKVKVIKSALPVAYDGKYYKRVGNTTREMQGEELREFFVRGAKWDGVTGDYELDEIDEKTVRKFLRMAIANGRLRAADESDSLESVLEKLKLSINGKLTHGAIMLFGKNPQKYFINTVVRVGRLKDDITIVGDRLIEGNLFEQAGVAEEAIKNFINVKYEITGEDFVRKSIWDYPLEAVREALFNALIHRDYFKYNIQTQIKIYDDRIWFFNVGGLPEGITIEQLKVPHPSVARNPLLVHVFYLAGFIEEYGSGIERIVRSISSQGLPEPLFKEEFSGFSVYLKKEEIEEKALGKNGLNDRQRKAITTINTKGKIDNAEYCRITGAIKKTATRDLGDFVKKGILERVGRTGKGTYYVLKSGRAQWGQRGH